MPFGSSITALSELAHDLLFPKRCLGCHEFDNFICDKCLDSIIIKNNFCCPICNREIDFPTVCPNCVGESVISGLWVVSNYHNKLVKEVIHLIKYSYCDALSEVWEKMIMKYFERERFWPEEAILIPVPLHKRRYLERGFNQSIIIGNILNKVRGNNICDKIIARKRYGKHQAMLDVEKRKESIKGCFKLISDINWKEDLPKEVILVDDVYTTGATMQECARTLKGAGFEKIYGFAMARG
jgi:ComF family protein